MLAHNYIPACHEKKEKYENISYHGQWRVVNGKFNFFQQQPDLYIHLNILLTVLYINKIIVNLVYINHFNNINL